MGEGQRQLVHEPHLRALRQEFKRCSETYPPLYHDRLIAWSSSGEVTLADVAWDEFTAANPQPPDTDDDWWVWDRTLRAPAIGRFWGSPDGLSEFEKLAESAALVLRKMRIDISGPRSGNWLSLLHDIAFRQQLLLLRSSLHLWGIDDEDFEQFDELVEEWHLSPEGVRQYPLHPCRWEMAHNVFTSSMAAIDAALAPASILSTPAVLDPTFVATLFSEAEAATEQNSGPPKCRFKQELKGVWQIQYVENGKVIEAKRIQTKWNEGFVICQQLLASSGRRISNDNLGSRKLPVHAVERKTEAGESLIVDLKELLGVSDDEDVSDSGERSIPIITDEGIRNVEAQTRILEVQRDQARTNGDEKTARSLQEKLDQHNQFLCASRDLRGRPRKYAAGSKEEQARSRVSKAIGKCFEELRLQGLVKLAQFLELNLDAVGGGRVYLRASEVTWET